MPPTPDSARLTPGGVALILDRIRRTPGLDVDADNLARHLAAIDDDAAWSTYVERMIVAMAGVNELRTVLDRMVTDAQKARDDVQARERVEIARIEASATDAQARERAEIARIEAGNTKFSIFSKELAGPALVAVTSAICQLVLHYVSR